MLHSGNPTGALDPFERPQGSDYPVGVQPDPNYRGYVHSFGYNKSPNGVIEYTGDAFDGQLDGWLVVTRFSNNNDLLFLQNDSQRLQAELERLIAEDGWVTLVCLFWLEPGASGVGSGEGNLVRLPEGKAPASLGKIHLGEDEAAARAVPGAAAADRIRAAVQRTDVAADEETVRVAGEDVEPRAAAVGGRGPTGRLRAWERGPRIVRASRGRPLPGSGSAGDARRLRPFRPGPTDCRSRARPPTAFLRSTM